MTSSIKVNKIEKSSGSTIEIGGPGTAVNLACGSTQTGFGRTGTVNWCTTAKTSPLTVESGKGYFLNTTCGSITVTLPSSPSAGDIVAFKDYANKWDCNSVAVCRGGSKINGECHNAELSTQSQSVTLIYVDGTKGWQDIHDSTSNVTGVPTFIVATGGTITTSGNDKIHTFNADGNFIINSAPTPANNNVSYMVVAGGAGSSLGGGGAGGFREGKTPATPYTASPLNAPAGLPVSVQTYPVTVGGGGAGNTVPPGNNAGAGSNSIFSSITSAGGGIGAANSTAGGNGGSGGGGGGGGSSNAGGTGNTPPTNPAQGTNGGAGGQTAPVKGGGGGGGASAAGGATGTTVAGVGGAGVSTEITGSAVARSGGGGGGARNAPANTGGAGGTGGGGAGKPYAPGNGTSGTANTGGGGGGAGSEDFGGTGGAGGSGVVIIRYKFQ